MMNPEFVLLQERLIDLVNNEKISLVDFKIFLQSYELAIIDCDAPPLIPDDFDFTVHEHIKGGQFKFTAANSNVLYIPKKVARDGHKLRKELANSLVLNANVLDYLLKNTHLIPEEWKGKYIYFFGTIYRNSRGSLYVRFIHFHGSTWYWNSSCLNERFGLARCVLKNSSYI